MAGNQVIHKAARLLSSNVGLSKLKHTAAIVGSVPKSFAESLSSVVPLEPINVEKAREQHAKYVDLLKGLLSTVIQIPANDSFPDCPFVEDTAVVVGSKALVTRPGAPSREGEVAATKKALTDLGFQTFETTSPATIDGGDVFFSGDHLFVGLSGRTNELGVDSLRKAFPDIEVVSIPLNSGYLHLKSVISRVSEDKLAVEDTAEAWKIFDVIQKHSNNKFTAVKVSDSGAANTLLVNDTLIYSSAYSTTSTSALSLSTDKTVALDMSEFHKADGGLTCLSILLDLESL